MAVAEWYVANTNIYALVENSLKQKCAPGDFVSTVVQVEESHTQSSHHT